jgi:hypothetical protein
MEDEKGTVVEITPRKPRKSSSRKTSSGRTRKSPTRRKAPARARRAPSRRSFEEVIRSITAGVSVARAAIAEASEAGAGAVRRVVGDASTASRRTVTRLASEWKAMDPKKKARILAALLGAAAAASAPLVRSRLKRR